MTSKYKVQGLTLVELLVTTSVLTIILGIAVPSYKSLVQSAQSKSETNKVLSLVQLARSEAIKLDKPVTVCPTEDFLTCSGAGDWSKGAIAYYVKSGASNIIAVKEASKQSIEITGPASVIFTAIGTTSKTAITVTTAESSARAVCIRSIGRAESSKNGACA